MDARRKRRLLGCLLTAIVVLSLMAWFGSTEAVSWDYAVRSDRVSSYQDYVRRFPAGPHASEARSRMAALTDADNRRRDADSKLREVCSGKGAQEAAMYQTSSSFHPVTVYRLDDGHFLNVDGTMPREWRPGSVTACELVACVGEQKEVLVQTCHYTGGFESTRYQYQTSVVLRAARTAEVVAEHTFAGSEPSECPVSITKGSPFNVRTRVGREVDFSDITAWLKGRVNPREGG